MRFDKNNIREDMKVYSSDDERLGKVIFADQNGFRIEKGVFFPKDYDISYEAIREVKEDDIHLALSKEELEKGVTSPQYATGAEERRTSETMGAEKARIPLTEEHLDVSKSKEEVGRVRVSKEAYTEEETVRVPVTREEVRVERVPATGEAATEGLGAKEDVEVPVYEERAHVEKRPHVTEEVQVSKERLEEEETHREPLRKERPVVEEEGMRTSGRERGDEGDRGGLQGPPPPP